MIIFLEMKEFAIHVISQEMSSTVYSNVKIHDRRVFLSKGYQAHANMDDYHALLSKGSYRKLCKLENFVKNIVKEFK